MRSLALLTVCFVLGALGTYLFVESRSGRIERETVSIPEQATHESVAPPASVSGAVPLAAKPSARSSVGGEPTDAERAAREAERLAMRERFSHEDVRDLLQRALEGRLAGRQLSPDEYDRLADAVLRLRAAQRVARGLEKSQASAEVLARNRDALVESLGEIERITGVAPSDLGTIVPSEGGLTDERNDDPENIVHETLPDDSR